MKKRTIYIILAIIIAISALASFGAGASAQEGDIETKYGTIPSEYSSVTDYPIALFKADGSFFGAYPKFNTALDKFVNLKTDCNILIRDNYTYGIKYDNLSKGSGTLNVDLGGHTVSLGTQMLYNADAKSNGDVTVNTYNGTILAGSTGVVRLLGWGSTSYDVTDVKNFDFTFKNINFGFETGAASASLVTYYLERASSGSPGPAFNKITCTDCTFDISASAAESVTVFNVGATNSGKLLSGTYTVNGGEIITNDAKKLNVYTLIDGTESSIAFGKGSDGSYTKITLPIDADMPSEVFPDAHSEVGANLKAEATASTDGSVQYVLVESNGYWGEIPEEYADTDKFPFVVFTEDTLSSTGYSFYSANECFTGTGGALVSVIKADKRSVVLMRRNYIHNNAVSSDLGKIKNVTVDLGTHTLTDGYGSYYGLIYGSRKTANDTTFNMMNGTVVLGSHPLITYYSKTYANAFNVNLYDLTIKANASTTTKNILINRVTTSSGQTSTSLPINIKAVRCIFDLSEYGVSDTTLINARDTSTLSDGAIISVDIVGGRIIANATTKITYTDVHATNGSYVKVLKDDNGEYVTLTLPKGTTAPDEVFISTNESGSDIEMLFAIATETDSNVTYKLGRVLKTKYGNIHPTYEDEEKYPFAVFVEDATSDTGYTFLTATECYTGTNGALTKVFNLGKGAVVLMRRNFVHNNAVSSDLGKIDEVTVDLNTYTLTDGYDSYYGLIYASRKQKNDTKFTLKNGSVILDKHPLISYYSKTYTNPFDISLEDLTIKTSATASCDDIIVGGIKDTFAHTQSAFSMDITIKNCTVDLTAGSGRANSIINANDTSTKSTGAILTINISGLSIIGGSDFDIGLSDVNDENGSSVAFGLDTKLTLPLGTAAPDEVFITSDGESIFNLSLSDETNTIYRPIAVAVKEFIPKTSISLYSSLIYNVYVPKSDALLSFTLAGKTFVNDGSLDSTEIGGRDYICIKLPLSAIDAAKDNTLCATLSLGKREVTGSFTVSIIKYCEKILGADIYSAIEKRAVGNVLSYVRAAYEYFSGNAISEDEANNIIAQITSIIGENYDEKDSVTPSGAYSESYPGLKSATFDLLETPQYIFHLDGTVEAQRFSFTRGEKRLTHEIHDGYITVSVWAYELCDGISIHIDGEKVADYHLSSYLAFAKENNNEKLSSLMERFYAYADAANSYRNEVLGICDVSYTDDTLTLIQDGAIVKHNGGKIYSGIPVTVKFDLPEGQTINSLSVLEDGCEAVYSLTDGGISFVPKANKVYSVTATAGEPKTACASITFASSKGNLKGAFAELYTDGDFAFENINAKLTNLTTHEVTELEISEKTTVIDAISSGAYLVEYSYKTRSYISTVTLGADTTPTLLLSTDALAGSVDCDETVTVAGKSGTNYYLEGIFSTDNSTEYRKSAAGLLLYDADGQKIIFGLYGPSVMATVSSDGTAYDSRILFNIADSNLSCDPDKITLGVYRRGGEYFIFVNGELITSYFFDTEAQSAFGYATIGATTDMKGFEYSVSENYLDAIDSILPQGEKEIDLFFIAGQSNASGSSIYNEDDLIKYTDRVIYGATNVWYAGDSRSTVKSTTPYSIGHKLIPWQLARLGFGGKDTMMGPEVGMALALSEYYNTDSGKTAGIIKLAHGGTGLIPLNTLNNDVGTWTPPSYIQSLTEEELAEIETHAGELYEAFLNEIATRIAELRKMGYTKFNFKGIVWTQGALDKNNPDEYSKIFPYFASDLRRDLSVIATEANGTETDLSSLLIVITEQNVTTGTANPENVKKIQKFVDMQRELARTIPYVYTIDNSEFVTCKWVDGKDVIVGTDASHYSDEDMLEIGIKDGEKLLELTTQ